MLLVLTTFPTPEAARSAAITLVEEGLAACVNVLPGVTSHYRWEGKLEETREVMLLIKSVATAYEKLEARLLELHPFQVPEIIALPVERGLEAYLAWAAASVTGQISVGANLLTPPASRPL